MTDDIHPKLNGKDEYPHEGSLSDGLLVAVEDLLKKTDKNCPRQPLSKNKSKSLDDLRIKREYEKKQTNENQVSNTTRTEVDLSIIGCDIDQIEIDKNQFNNDIENDLPIQKSRSAPASPTKFYDKELAAFIQCEEQQQFITDNFVYNIDLSNANESTHQPQSKADIFLDDDYSSNDILYQPTINIIHSSLINNCLTITEENEEELEQLRLDDDKENEELQRNHLEKLNDGTIPRTTLHDDDDRADLLEFDNNFKPINMNKNLNKTFDDEEGLSTIYESPSLQTPIEEENENDDDDDIYDDAYDKLVVYDIAHVDSMEKSIPINRKCETTVSPSSKYRSPIFNQNSIRSCYTDASIEPFQRLYNNNLSVSNLCGTTTTITSKVFKLPSKTKDENSCSSPVINKNENISINKSFVCLTNERQSPTKSSPMSLSVPILLLTTNDEQNSCTKDNNDKLMSFQPTKQMKVTQSSSSSLSDFIMPTTTSTLKSTIHYEEVPSVHQSLTDCSSIQRLSCCVPIVDEDSSIKDKFTNENPRRPSFTRRILTNGLLLSHCSNSKRTQPPLTFNQHRHQIKPKSEEKLSSLSSPTQSSSSSSNSPINEKFMSRSDYLIQQDQQKNLTQQRKATSLKTISETSNQQSSKIVYPIDFETNHNDCFWYERHSSTHHNKVPTSDSGIVIDTAGTRQTSKSSIEENDADGIHIDITNSGKLKQYETNYRKTLTDLTIIKKNIVDIESRLSEAMRELEIERALVEGEHELVFKQILDASESDQEKIRHLYDGLQLLIERIMTEKNSIRNEIDYTQQTLFKLEDELHELEEQYRPSDDKILKKKEIIAETRKKHEDLEFQLMELETRCEAELEQAEEHFQTEQIIVTQNSKIRQNTLRDLDHQQNIILHQAITEKEKLEKQKQKLKLLFKQKKFEANELEQKINDISSNQKRNFQENYDDYQHSHYQRDRWLNGNKTVYHSTPTNLYSTLNYHDSMSSPNMNIKDIHQDKLNELNEMIAMAKLEKMTLLEQQLRDRYNEFVQCHDEQVRHIELEEKFSNEFGNNDHHSKPHVKLREKNRIQERPLTRYLPIRSVDFDLRAHIEGAGHLLNSPHIHITSTSCRGFLLKMGGMKFKTWNRRWFVFDRKRRSLFYYQDKTETKLRGCIYFQSIVEVYVDHLQSMSLRSPEPREATFIVKTNERPYYLVAPTVESMRIWVDVIITGAEGNTFAGES